MGGERGGGGEEEGEELKDWKEAGEGGEGGMNTFMSLSTRGPLLQRPHHQSCLERPQRGECRAKTPRVPAERVSHPQKPRDTAGA